MKKNNIVESITSLWFCFGKRRYVQLFLLLFLMMISVFAETLSIASVIPFLSALTNPEKLMNFEWFQPILQVLNVEFSNQLLLPLTIVFISFAVFAALIRVLQLWVYNRLTASMGVQLRNELVTKTLFQPYEYHLEQNSSNLISLTTEKTNIVIQTGILQVLLFVNALVTSLSIILVLVFINPVIALLTFLILGGGYLIIGLVVRSNIKKNGLIVAKNQPIAVKYIQEGLGGIRDIIMDGSQQIFISQYSKVTSNIQMKEAKNSFLGNLPKSILEVMSITFIAVLAYILQTGSQENQQVIPILGALALGAQRLLPALQQMYFSWSRVYATQSIIEEVVEQLSKPISKHKKITKKPIHVGDCIQLKNVAFKYNNSKDLVLKSINITIPKGSKTGFIGKTGTGKSTLLDVFMGLLIPTKGQLTVDGVEINQLNLKNWQSNIAHVPQHIFLSDATIAENIAFGSRLDEIDMKRLKKSTELAYLNEFIEDLPKGLFTKVGERGVQLSGGQRQRIGIARALYKQVSIIVLDEATSALDNKTELQVMKAINSLDNKLTVLIIAHRLSTLKNCDTIYKLSNGAIAQFGNYQQVIGSIATNK